MKPGQRSPWRSTNVSKKTFVKCDVCGKEFLKANCARRYNHDCCSRECQQKLWRERGTKGKEVSGG